MTLDIMLYKRKKPLVAYRRKRKYSKRKVSTALAVPRVSRFVPNQSGFPDSIQSTVIYHAFADITSVSGVPGQYVFRANSTFDPDFTGSGHQPYYRDTYAAIYDNYSVVSSKITVEFINLGAAVVGEVGLMIDNNGTAITSDSILNEASSSRGRFITPLSGSSSKEKIVVSWTAKDWLKIDPYNSAAYKSDVGANPTYDSYFMLWWVSATGGVADKVQFRVIIEYDTIWSELSTIAAS